MASVDSITANKLFIIWLQLIQGERITSHLVIRVLISFETALARIP